MRPFLLLQGLCRAKEKHWNASSAMVYHFIKLSFSKHDLRLIFQLWHVMALVVKLSCLLQMLNEGIMLRSLSAGRGKTH